MSLQVTSAAAQEILAAAQRSNAGGMALRVAARQTSDGLDYGMGFDEPTEDDAVMDFDGLTVLIAPESHGWLEHTVIDFVEIEQGRRDFIFVEQGPVGDDSRAPSDRKGCGSGGCSGCGA